MRNVYNGMHLLMNGHIWWDHKKNSTWKYIFEHYICADPVYKSLPKPLIENSQYLAEYSIPLVKRESGLNKFMLMLFEFLILWKQIYRKQLNWWSAPHCINLLSSKNIRLTFYPNAHKIRLNSFICEQIIHFFDYYF